MKKVRVLHVAECIGGVERYLRCLLKYSTCENIMIFSQLYRKEEYENLADHVEIMYMHHGVNLSVLGEAIKLRNKIKKYNPDIVYAHSSIAGAVTRIACVGLKVKVIYNPHGWSFNMESKWRKFYIFFEKIMACFCDAIICISDAEKDSALKEHVCKEDKLHVIYNGIDIEECNDKKELTIFEDSFVIGMVGRICRQKAPDVFVRMAGEVQKEIKEACFIIVGDVIEGDVEEKKKIQKIAEELGIRLFITGWVSNPLDYMNRFDVGCLLSRWEGFGLAIPEYMITKTPIVATKVDAIPYLITDGENGLLVEKDDWMSASEKVIEIYKEKRLREKLVTNGLKTVRGRFDANRVSKECEQLYENLIK